MCNGYSCYTQYPSEYASGYWRFGLVLPAGHSMSISVPNQITVGLFILPEDHWKCLHCGKTKHSSNHLLEIMKLLEGHSWYILIIWLPIPLWLYCCREHLSIVVTLVIDYGRQVYYWKMNEKMNESIRLCTMQNRDSSSWNG